MKSKQPLFFKSDFPFRPSISPVYYGWIIAIVTTIGMLMSVPGQTMSVGVFTEFLIEAAGLNRLQLSFAYMVGTIASGLLVSTSGKLIDRLGTRVMIVFAGLGLALFLIMLSLTYSIVHTASDQFNLIPRLWTSFLIMSAVFLGLRFTGQGLMTMVSRMTLARWFESRRGLVMGISGVFTSLGFSAAPQVLNLLIQYQGWRGTLYLLAVICGLGAAFVGWLFYRENPEECGLALDGSSRQSKPNESEAVERENTLAEAVKTSEFWIFNLGTCAYPLIMTGVIFHISSIGQLEGLSRNDSFSIFLPMSVFSLITHLLIGWISDRSPLKYLYLTMMVSMIIGVFGLGYF